MSERMDSPQRARNRQLVVAAVIVLVLFGAVFGFLVLGNRPGQLGAAERVWENKYRTPGDAVDPKRAWIASSEAELDALREELEQQDRHTDERLTEMRDMLEALVEERRNDADRTADQPPARERPRRPANASDRTESTSSPVQASPRAEPVRGGRVLPPPPGMRPASSPEGSADSARAESEPPSSDRPEGRQGPVLDRVTNRVRRGVDAIGGDEGREGRARRAEIVKVRFQSPSDSAAHISDTIPAGSFGRAVLLNGLDAPTGGRAQSDPHPVLLQLIDNGNLPNRYRHRVEECRIVASGYGNLSDERAYLRLERLSCVLRNGEIVSQSVKGYVSGEDGKIGLHGELISKQGTMIARSFMAGLFSGIGDGIAQSYTDISTSAQGAVSAVDPDRVFEHGAAEGVNNSLEKIADWYLERADELFPIIAVNGGRTVEVTLTDDVSLGTNLLERFTPPEENY